MIDTLLCKVTFPTVSLQNALVVPRAAFVTYTITESVNQQTDSIKIPAYVKLKTVYFYY